ncbi:MAG: hypothetical protein FGM61_03590 [Sediminibacterium sp.]|nr:hypothetical protein [Sediminibacterium sp.]
MKKIFFLITLQLLVSVTNTYCQSFNQEKVALTNFIIRMYKTEPFTGVKVFLDYENKYLISLVKLSSGSYSSENDMNRVAEVKAKAQVNQFINGSYITSESIITTTATTSRKNSAAVQDVMETITESSMGYVNALELISTFTDENEPDKKVFIYLRELEKIKKKK